MLDLLEVHATATALYQAGLLKLSADLHFSGKLQVDSLGDLVLDVPSALLRGCLAAIKEPGVELYLGENWKSRIVVMHKPELDKVGGPRVISERGKDFDYKIGQSTTGNCNCEGPPVKVWQLDIVAPDLVKLRQSYGLNGEPEGGFRAIFGMRKTRLFTDGSKVRKDSPIISAMEPKPSLGGYEWVLKKHADAPRTPIPGGGGIGAPPSADQPVPKITPAPVAKPALPSVSMTLPPPPAPMVAGVRKKGDINPDVELQPHQRALANQIDPEHPARKLLLWNTGSGKSLGALAAAEAYGQPYTVVGPAAMRPTWRSEQRKYTDKSLPSAILSYQKAMQPDSLPYTDSLVVDEAQRIINPATAQSQAVQEAARKAKQVLLLSGTPIVNRPGDIAPMLSVLTGNEITPSAFESRYFGQEARPRTWRDWWAGKDKQYDPVLRHRDELKGLLEGKVDYYSPKSPDVPTKYTDFETEMGESQSRLYRAMYGAIPWRLRLRMDQSTDLTPTELQQLKSFLSGPRQVGLSDYPFASHRDPLRSFYGSPKLQLAFKNMQEKLNADPRHKGIFFSNFVQAGLHPLRAALEHNKIPHVLFDGSLSDAERDAAVRAFNEGRARVALVGPAGAEGISLRGAQLLAQMDSHWNQARMRQSAARGIRFNSHTGLPDSLRNIEVQRYVSKLPAKQKSWLQMMHLLPYNSELQPAADDYVKAVAERKERSNSLIMDLLREVGSKTP